MIKTNSRWNVSALILFMGLLLCSSPAMAIDSLQLDISNGIYVGDTTYSQGDVFTLFALLIPKKGVNTRAHEYTISAAITPLQADSGAGADFGSIIFGSKTLISNDMYWGTPPAVDPGALPSHGAFPTYYWEQKFDFATAPCAIAYNVQNVFGTHTGPEPWVVGSPGPKMSYMAFTIDVSGLKDGYAVHFDLYHTDGDNEFVDKAPFSHDAESGSRKVPEPGSLVLMGVGLMGVALFGRRKK